MDQGLDEKSIINLKVNDVENGGGVITGFFSPNIFRFKTVQSSRPVWETGVPPSL